MTRILLLAALCAAGCATTNGGGAAERLASGVVLLKPGASKSAAAAPADSMWQDIDLHGRQCYCGASTLTTGFGKDTLRVRRVGTEMYEPGVYERVMAEERAAAESLLSLREQAASAAPDSAWLYFTAPSFGSLGCEPDTAKPLHGGQRVYVIRLRGQVPNYWRGMMQTVAGMDSVRLLTRPDTVWRASVQPGTRCSVRVAAGEYVAETVGQRCAAWRVVRVP